MQTLHTLRQLALAFGLATGCGTDPATKSADTDTRPSADTARPEDSASGDSGDSGTDRPPESDPGWTLGTVQSCEAPNPLRYVESPRALGSLAGVSGMDEFGSVAWWSEGGDDYLIHTTIGRGLAKRRIDFPEGEASLLSVDQDVRTILLRDLDGNGLVDMLGLGTGLFIQYDVLTESPTTVVLIGPREGRAVYDVETLDLDGDGDDDLVLGTNNDPTAGAQSPLQVVRNLGDRTWSDPTDILPDHTPATFDLSTVDIDEDGVLDLYVCNDQGALYGGNSLLLGDGSGGFSIAPDGGLSVTTDCMGVSHADIDHDGRMDTFLTALDRHWLLIGDGPSGYDATATCLPPLEGAQMGWGSAPVDADNDGLVDLIVGTSEFSVHGALRWPLLLLRQDEDGIFTDIGPTVGLPPHANTRAVLTRDLNEDGVLDIIASDFSRDPWLLLSSGCGVGHWLEVDGPAGATVEVRAGGEVWTHLLSHSPGWAVSAPPRVHIGLGAHETVDLVTLFLPSSGGPEQVHLVGPIDANQRLSWAPEG